MKRKVLPEVLAGEKISALAITEPSGGSDVANLRTTARREGDHYVVNGSKMFITSGMRADYYTVAVRTGGPGAGGVSLLLIERDREGFGAHQAQEDGLVGVRHRPAVLRQCARAGRQPDRPARTRASSASC